MTINGHAIIVKRRKAQFSCGGERLLGLLDVIKTIVLILDKVRLIC